MIVFNRIQKLRINAKDHMNQATKLDPENPFFEVFVCPELGILRCGGIEIFGEYKNIYRAISKIMTHLSR